VIAVIDPPTDSGSRFQALNRYIPIVLRVCCYIQKSMRPGEYILEMQEFSFMDFREII